MCFFLNMVPELEFTNWCECICQSWGTMLIFKIWADGYYTIDIREIQDNWTEQPHKEEQKHS